MYEIPLFPLNSVLFPDMPLPLHIFEERYKLMIERCIQEKRPFGVVLIRNGESDTSDEAEPYLVGCSAQITQVQPLNEGRMFIMAIGRERFRILSLKRDKPYLVGVVESAPLQDEDNMTLADESEQLRPIVIKYLEILARIGKVEFDIGQVPDDPEALIYLAASIIQVSSEEKQDFLATDSASYLLAELRRVYQREVDLMKVMPTEDIGSFSVN